MALDRAGLGAQTFLIPQQAPQAQVAPQKQFDDAVPMLEDLQYVENQTSDWYRKASELKSFMQSVQKNLGIDVRVPDLSRPESIELNSIYKNAIADLLAHGNELKTGYKMQQLNTQMGMKYAPGVDPTKQAVSTMRQGADFDRGNLDQAVTELNDKLRMPSYTEEEHKEKLADRQRLLSVYTQRLNATSDPREKFWIQNQINGIISPTQGEWRPYRDSDYDKKMASKDKAMEVFFRKAVNFTRGTSGQWSASTKPIPGQPGKFYRRNTEYAGLKYGDYPSPVKYAEMDPTDQTGYFVLQDGTQVPFDAKDPVPMLQGLIDANARYGFNGSEMMDFMSRKGIFTGAGDLNVAQFQDKPENEQANLEKQKEQEVENAAYHQLISDKLRKESKGKTWRLFRANDRVEIPVKLGNAPMVTLIATGDNKFKVENFDEAFKTFFIDKKTNKINNDAKQRFEVTFNNPDGVDIDTILQNLLPMIPKNRYDEFMKALNIPLQEVENLKKKLKDQPDDSDLDSSGTEVAPTKETEAQRILREFRERNK